MSRIIGLTGRKQSGKDTAAAVFEAAGFEKLSFATLLKEMLATLLEQQGVDDDTIWRMLHDDLKEVPTPFLNGRTPRYAMQTLGTEWGRKLIHPDIWVDATMRVADLHQQVVIADVRFPNEVDAITDRYGTVYRVSREGVAVDDHESEVLIDGLKVDGTIYNTAVSSREFQAEIVVLFGFSDPVTH